MKSLRVRLWLAVILFVLSLGILLASSWPEPRQTRKVPLPALSLPTPEAYYFWPGAEAGG